MSTIKTVHHLEAASLATRSPELGTPTLTVGQIAERVRPLVSDVDKTRERVRHWTRENLVSPVKQHHAGTGKHREYDESTTADVAILSMLADAGLHLAGHTYLSEALVQVRSALENWNATTHEDLYLEISRTRDDKPLVAVHPRSEILNPDARISILINISRLLREVDMPRRPARAKISEK